MKFNLFNPTTWFQSEDETYAPEIQAAEEYAADKSEVKNPGTPSKAPIIAPSSSGRKSQPQTIEGSYQDIASGVDFIKPGYQTQWVPLIRKIVQINPDLSQALNNVTALGNTGHRINFDPGVSPEEQTKMRLHLQRKQAEWFSDYGGVDGFVNRLLSQLFIGGAIAAETVPAMNLKTIQRVPLILPEQIRCVYNKTKLNYDYWQKVEYANTFTTIIEGKPYVKLNRETFRYLPLNGDTEVPYGFPPYLAALKAVSRQANMLDNIDFIVEQIGLVGFMEALVDKPQKLDTETDAQFESRLNKLLDDTKKGLQEGLRDGISVAFQGDVDYDFKNPTKNASGVSELFQENELQIASGIKQDAVLLGRGYATSETQITVVFMKMISELANPQRLIESFMQYLYTLELRLAEFQFDYLSVKMKPSTLHDEMKLQQAFEVKIRNANALYNMGIYSQGKVAEVCGEERPDRKTPRVMQDLSGDAKKAADRKDDKNASAKKGRDKGQIAPKTVKDKKAGKKGKK